MMDLLHDFATFLRINRSSCDKTVDAYTKDVKSFCLFNKIDANKINDLKKINEDNLKQWLISRRNNVSNRTISRQIVAIKMFFTFLNEVHDARNDIMLNMNGLKFKSGLPKAVQSEQINEIVEKLNTFFKYKTQWELARDKLLFILLFSSGLRISEALALKHKNFLSNEILVLGKGRKERIVPILDVIKVYYDRYKKELINNSFTVANDDFVFINAKTKQISVREVDKRFQIIRINKNLQYFSPHVMRHSFATSLLENGANIRQIQAFLGHENLATTQKYTKVTRKVISEKLKKIKW